MAIKTFTTGEVLTASDTNTYLANSGLVYIASTTFTSTANAQQINNCFTSTYDNYRIVFRGVSSATSNVLLYFRAVDGTTPDTSSVYFTSGFSTNTGAAVATTWTASQDACRISTLGDTASEFVCDVLSPQLASRTLLTSHFTSSATNDFFTGQYGDMINNNTQYEGFVLIPASGTWSGTITIFGYRKA